MRSITHSLAGGAAAGATTLLILPGRPAAALAAIAFGTVVAGELPDLDIAGSKISRGTHARRARGLLRTPLAALAVPALVLGIAIRAMLRPLGRLGAHRGATHTLIGLVLFTVLIPPIYYAAASGAAHLLESLHPALQQPAHELRTTLAEHAAAVLSLLGASTLVGVASHLALDWMTPSGIALLAPFDKRRLRAPVTIRTGSLSELPVTALMLLLWAIVVLSALEHRGP